MHRPLTIVVDFDDTLVSYSDEEGFYPQPGSAEAIRELRALGHRVMISTCRFTLAKRSGKLKEEIQFIVQLLSSFGIEFDELYIEDKPIADYYVDDRAVPYEGDWKTVMKKILGS